MMSSSFRAVVTGTAAAGIGVTTFTPRPLFDITVTAIAVVVALGWAPLLPIAGKRGPVTGILLGTALVSAGLVRLTHSLAWLAPILAGALIAIFIAQLLRKGDRSGLIDQVAAHFIGAIVVASAAGWLAIGARPIGSSLTLSAAVCLATAAIVAAFPLPPRISIILTIFLATSAGVGLGFGLEEMTLLTGTLIGLAAGVIIAVVHYLFQEYSDSDSALASLSGALLAVSVSGVPMYVLGRVLLHMP